jgi:hypothetical protein
LYTGHKEWIAIKDARRATTKKHFYNKVRPTIYYDAKRRLLFCPSGVRSHLMTSHDQQTDDDGRWLQVELIGALKKTRASADLFVAHTFSLLLIVFLENHSID